MEQIWRLPDPRRFMWRAWDGEVVVYNDITGNTHHLGPLAAEIFERLLIGPIGPTVLIEGVAQTLNVDIAPDLSEAVKNTIEQFYGLGIIEPVDGQ